MEEEAGEDGAVVPLSMSQDVGFIAAAHTSPGTQA